ncbi:MAG TPA: hypothetical protein RMH99_21545 [Sandaracinaceae bacterium LLY-WYZ-13_1]|nr:hypothetical protein [Sandaracinaceae bacterium LLY-WYZ-13_1]
MLERPVRTIHLLIRLGALTLFGVAMAGCATGGGWAAMLAVVLSAGTLVLSGCSMSHENGGDAAVEDASTPRDDAGDGDAGGTWSDCCVDGVVDSCFCPAGAACNYGWYTDCGGGTCAFGPEGCGDGGVDAGPEAEDAGMSDAGVDAGGTWSDCCVDGVIDSCFCPGGAECNYGWFNDCGDGLCVGPSEMCPAPADAGTP